MSTEVKLTVRASREEIEAWKVAAHGELLTLSGWVRHALGLRAALTERDGEAGARLISVPEARDSRGGTRPEASDTPVRSVSADAVAAAEDWLKARADRPAKPYPKPGSS